MSYQARFEGWDLLTIEDLLVAYRKTKADCFFENTFPTAINLPENRVAFDNIAVKIILSSKNRSIALALGNT